jgi:hypothetical protein
MDVVITEYMTIEYQEEGLLGHTHPGLEELLDSKGRSGWKLFNITYLELSDNEVRALLIFERGLTNG